MARPALARLEVELEGAVALADAAHGVERLGRERRAPEVGVNHHARRVDDRPQRGLASPDERGLQAFDDERGGKLAGAGLGVSRDQRGTKAADFLVEHLAYAAAPVHARKGLHRRQPQQVIDRRDDARP